MRISDWSSDVCSSDLQIRNAWAGRAGRDDCLQLGALTVINTVGLVEAALRLVETIGRGQHLDLDVEDAGSIEVRQHDAHMLLEIIGGIRRRCLTIGQGEPRKRHFDIALRIECRSEEHTSELQSLMRISYAVFCLKK